VPRQRRLTHERKRKFRPPQVRGTQDRRLDSDIVRAIKRAVRGSGVERRWPDERFAFPAGSQRRPRCAGRRGGGVRPGRTPRRADEGFGKALDQHWKENVGYPGVEDAYKRSARADVSLETIHNDCKSRSDFVSLDKNQTRALEGFDGLYSGEAAAAKAAFYVSGLTVEKPARLCQATHRAHLVEALKDYYRLMGRVREERMMSTSGPFAAQRLALMSTPGRGERGATPPPSARSDERVVNGLRTLLVDGYLSRRDLAPVLGPPGDLELALRGAEPKRTGCA
jgi:hypothetical protein